MTTGPFTPCDVCGEFIASHDPPLGVFVKTATMSGTVDLDADELEADGAPDYLLALFDLTAGIGGGSVWYGASCFMAAIGDLPAETARLGQRSERARREEERAKRARNAKHKREAEREVRRAQRRQEAPSRESSRERRKRERGEHP